MKKKILLATLAIIIVLVLFNVQLIHYGIYQGLGQLKVIWNAQPVSEILDDKDQPDSLKAKLKYTLDVRQFAINELGLHNSDNYTTYYDQGGKPILWNVTASEAYELKPYLWKFPILGSVPYKGFFDLAKAIKERDKLKEMGYDSRIRVVSGWSTLGILKDPILSNMLDRGEGQLAEVIIHELVHSTIFIKNEIVFNENLASFLGEEAAQIFLAEYFGDSSKQLEAYKNELEDSKSFKKYLFAGTKQLDSLYEVMKGKPDSLKSIKKHQFISSIAKAIDTVSFHQGKYYQIFDKALPNNAYFMSFMRYHSKEDSLRTALKQFDGNIVNMIDALKTQYE